MTDTVAVLTPVHQGQGEVLDFAKGTYRKQILPIGSINYTAKGPDGKPVTRKLTFDKAYLTDLAQAFKDKAYDAVKFILADGSNRHTLDPERVRGDITNVHVMDDGLYGDFQLSADAAQLIKDNPDLGVSARIVENLEHADGRTFGRAMHHVLGTLDPKVTGLRPWQAVELSNEDQTDEIVDLSEEHYETPKEGEMGNKVTQTDLPDDEVDLSQPEFEFDFSNTTVDLSQEAQEQLDLAVASGAEQASRLHQLELDLANSRWETERATFVRQGVPPAMLDLAGQILSQPNAPVIDLSNAAGEDETVDVADVVRGLLKEARGTIELSKEKGHTFDLTQEEQDEKLLSRWEEESPL